jgi:putative tryptophan/tyrosine transport system substrate-binding protein
MIVDGSCADLGKSRIAKRLKLAKASLGVALILLLTAPIAAPSQDRRTYRIGFLGLSSPADYAPNLQAFRRGLGDLGYEEGKNISIEYRWANGRYERLPALAAELVRLSPDALVTHAAPGIRAARQATTTIPIVMGVSSDPVRLGFVKSFARPGGNTTGVATSQVDLAAKRLELLKEVVPTLRQVAVLWNPTNPGLREDLKQMELASGKLGVGLRSFELVREPTALETVFAAILRDRPAGLIVVADSLVATHSARIAEFAVRNRLPAMGGSKEFVEAGGLISYAADFQEGWRVAARYVDKILRGAKPAELPVEQPTKFDLTINLKTAKALGLTIPPSLLVRADTVVEK